MTNQKIKSFLVSKIKQHRLNLHDPKKRLFREGYDKGKHAAYEEVLSMLDKKELDNIPPAKSFTKIGG